MGRPRAQRGCSAPRYGARGSTGSVATRRSGGPARRSASRLPAETPISQLYWSEAMPSMSALKSSLPMPVMIGHRRELMFSRISASRNVRRASSESDVNDHLADTEESASTARRLRRKHEHRGTTHEGYYENRSTSTSAWLPRRRPALADRTDVLLRSGKCRTLPAPALPRSSWDS